MLVRTYVASHEVSPTNLNCLCLRYTLPVETSSIEMTHNCDKVIRIDQTFSLCPTRVLPRWSQEETVEGQTSVNAYPHHGLKSRHGLK